MKKTIMQFLFPFIALIMMLFDGQITQVLMSVSAQRNTFAAQILLLCFFIGYFYFKSQSYILTVACFIGFLYDLYYYGVIGIYIVCLPLAIYCFIFLIKIVKPNIFFYLMIFVLISIFLQFSSYLLQILFGLTVPDFQAYIILYVAPSLFLNAVIYLIALLYGYKFFLNNL